MFLQVWKKAHPRDTALVSLYAVARKEKCHCWEWRHNILIRACCLLFWDSLKAICTPKLESIFSAQVISWLTHLQISSWIACRISLRIIQMSNYGSQTLWLLESPRMNFLNIWEKILNFVAFGSKFISFGNKEPQRVFAQGGLGWFYFVQQLQVWLTLVEQFGVCSLCRQLSASLQFAVGFLRTEKGGRKRRGEMQRIFLSVKDSWLVSSLNMQL